MSIVHLNRDTTLLVSTLPWVPGPEAECGGVAEVQLLFIVDVGKSWRGRWAHHYHWGWWLALRYLLKKYFWRIRHWQINASRFKSSMKHEFCAAVGWEWSCLLLYILPPSGRLWELLVLVQGDFSRHENSSSTYFPLSKCQVLILWRKYIKRVLVAYGEVISNFYPASRNWLRGHIYFDFNWLSLAQVGADLWNSQKMRQCRIFQICNEV